VAMIPSSGSRSKAAAGSVFSIGFRSSAVLLTGKARYWAVGARP
jgi:hypothetical protein